MAEVSDILCRFLCDSRWDDIPADVRHNAKRSLLNGLGTAFAGCRDVAIDATAKTMLPFSGKAEATVIGRPEKADAMTAAFLNAAAMNVHDFDDTHLRTVIHPTAPVAPALLALAETREVSGQNLLHALVLGIEVACRIGNAVSPGHYARGWHITATCGMFGAAAAVGKILNLTHRRMINALGAASAQSSGLVETLGFMAKSIGVGGAARGGLLAALLAQNGLDGPAAPLEGPRGFLRVTGDDPNYDDVAGGLGTLWETAKNIHKPYPGGVVLFPVIDAALEFFASDIPADRVKSVMLCGHPLLAQRTDRPNVETGREAQVSAQHAVGVCLVRGTAGLDDFSDAAVKDPAVRAVREKVKIVDDLSRAVTGVRAVFEMVDGGTKEIVVAHGRGTDERPLSDAEIEDKFRTLAKWGAPGCQNAEKLIDAVWSLDGSDDAGAVMAFMRPA
ncbi:MAG: MmgE/PrpD family protein [Rhodospirillaceae bacterium]